MACAVSVTPFMESLVRFLTKSHIDRDQLTDDGEYDESGLLKAKMGKQDDSRVPFPRYCGATFSGGQGQYQ